jgi:nucleotide-binding universal stress UspA family protein
MEMILVRLYRCGLDISELCERGLAVLEKIVVGYSDDEAGHDAVKLCGQIVAALGSEVTVVYPYSPLLSSEPAQAAEEAIRAELRALMPDSEMLAHATYHWSSSSWPIHALHSMASYENAQLIVLGAAREGIAGHLHVGLMERMVHGAPCAVLVAPAGYVAGEGLRRVGVGFADSAEGKAALGLGHELAHVFDGELSVIAASGLSQFVRSYAAQAAMVSELEAETYAATKASLQSAVAELAGDVPVHTQTVEGNAADVLVERSRELDLLVLGSRAYGPVRHALLGSVSAAVMREAHCPVLVMPRGCEPSAGEPAGLEGASASVAAD